MSKTMKMKVKVNISQNVTWTQQLGDAFFAYLSLHPAN